MTNLPRLGRAAAVVLLAAMGMFAATAPGAKSESRTAPAPKGDAQAAGLPLWAYPVTPPAAPRPHAAAERMRPAAAHSALQHVPGSTRAYTTAYISNLFQVPDWFPNEHPPFPEVVAKGRPPAVAACAYCHLPNGQGRPENESIAGLPQGYILQQLADFRHGLRKSSDPWLPSVSHMAALARSLSPQDARAAAAYFSSLHYRPWIRVVETKMAPVTHVQDIMLVPVPGAGQEPIGDRVIEVPENLKLTRLRDPHSGFIAYVPMGSIERGRELVWTGGHGKTIRCAICHGPELKGLGNVPSIVGRSPSQMARQLIDIQRGARNGPYTQLMKAPVRQLSQHDIVDIVAYLASLHP